MNTKKTVILMSLFCITIILAITGCKKDDDKNKLEESYFSVENGTFANADIPEPSGSQSAPVISSVYGNPSILEGGSNPISLQTSSSFKEVIVGVQGVKGYYAIPEAGSGKSLNETILLILLFSQTLENDSFVIVIALRDAQGLVSAHSTIQVTKIEAGTGRLQVSCSWDKLNDVDLHLVEPNGAEIYYGDDYSENGGELDVDSNADCYLDYINNENITYDDEAIIESGKYTVRVDFYSTCSITANTNFIVTTRYRGQIITPTTGTNPYSGSFIPSDEDGGGSGDGRQVMTFTIAPGKSDTPAETRIKFVYPKSATEKKVKGSLRF
jgi:hypothetical protein